MRQRRRHRIRYTSPRLITGLIPLRQYPIDIRLLRMKSVVTLLIPDKKEDHQENGNSHTQPGNRKDRIDLICLQVPESGLEEMENHGGGFCKNPAGSMPV